MVAPTDGKNKLHGQSYKHGEAGESGKRCNSKQMRKVILLVDTLCTMKNFLKSSLKAESKRIKRQVEQESKLYITQVILAFQCHTYTELK